MENKPENHKTKKESPYTMMTEIDGIELIKEDFACKDYLYDMLLMFNTLFLNSPYAVIILDKEQRIVNISKKFTEIFQYKPMKQKEVSTN